MKSRYFRVFTVTAVIVVSAMAAFSQGRVSTADKFIISAKAGGVNAVLGDVIVDRAGRTSRLFKGDELQTGEVVRTGVDGKAEILMNPGSYIRLGANAAFTFDSTNLDDVRINLTKGSAMFEVFGGEEYTIDVKAGTSRFALIETGIYRVDVDAKGEAVVSIHKGKVLPGLDAKKSVGSGKQIDYSGTAFLTAKFDKNATDDLSLWSKERAKQLSQVSASLRPDRLRDPLINSFFGRGWNLYNSVGLWIYDPFLRSYCFLPFGYGWNSPYGYRFGRSLWYYNLPQVIYNAPPPVRTPTKYDSDASSPRKVDRGFADIVKRPDNGGGRKVSSDGEVFVRQPTKVQIQPPPVFDIPMTKGSSGGSMPQTIVVSPPSGPVKTSN